jgi:hypothetical protein
MEYPEGQLAELKRYCTGLKAVVENKITYLLLEKLRLPAGCTPAECEGLLCPVERDGYPSRLLLSVQIKTPYSRNWNGPHPRIAERNWFAFSWKVNLTNPTLAEILLAHLNAFAKEK